MHTQMMKELIMIFWDKMKLLDAMLHHLIDLDPRKSKRFRNLKVCKTLRLPLEDYVKTLRVS
jgi:hypothetical protein